MSTIYIKKLKFYSIRKIVQRIIAAILIASIFSCNFYVKKAYSFDPLLVAFSAVTGRQVRKTADSVSENLERAIVLAGGETRRTLEELKRTVEEISRTLSNEYQDILDVTIDNLDTFTRNKLREIEELLNEINTIALNIIDATGNEIQEIIETSGSETKDIVSLTANKLENIIKTSGSETQEIINLTGDELENIITRSGAEARAFAELSGDQLLAIIAASERGVEDIIELTSIELEAIIRAFSQETQTNISLISEEVNNNVLELSNQARLNIKQLEESTKNIIIVAGETTVFILDKLTANIVTVVTLFALLFGLIIFIVLFFRAGKSQTPQIRKLSFVLLATFLVTTFGLLFVPKIRYHFMVTTGLGIDREILISKEKTLPNVFGITPSRILIGKTKKLDILGANLLLEGIKPMVKVLEQNVSIVNASEELITIDISSITEKPERGILLLSYPGEIDIPIELIQNKTILPPSTSSTSSPVISEEEPENRRVQRDLENARIREQLRDLEDELSSLRESKRTLDRQLASLQPQLQAAKNKTDTAQKELSQAKEVLEEIIVRNRMALNQAEESLAIQEKILARIAPLVEQGAIASSQLERQQQEVNYHRANIRRIEADGKMEQDNQQNIVNNKQSIFRREQSQLNSLEQEVGSLNTNLKSVKNKIIEIREQLDQL